MKVFKTTLFFVILVLFLTVLTFIILNNWLFSYMQNNWYLTQMWSLIFYATYGIFLVLLFSFLFFKEQIKKYKLYICIITIFFVVCHISFYYNPKIPYVPSDSYSTKNIEVFEDNFLNKLDTLDWISELDNTEEKKQKYLNNKFLLELYWTSSIPSIPFLYSKKLSKDTLRAKFFYNYENNNNFEFLHDEKLFPSVKFWFPIFSHPYNDNYEAVKNTLQNIENWDYN